MTDSTILPDRAHRGHAGPTLVDLPLPGRPTERLAEAVPETGDFVELFRLHYPRLVRALVLSGAPPTTGEDVAQEAFARTFRHWWRVRRGTNPPGYVYRVAFRLLRRRGLLTTTLLDDRAADTGPLLDETTASSVDLERALQALPPRRRACAVLCWCLDVSPVDAGEALGIAASTVRKQLELARQDLRADLES